MSETDESEPDQPVSMTKNAGPTIGRGGRAAKPPLPNLPLPRSMQAVFGAMSLIVVGSLIRVFAIGIGHTSQLTEYVTYANSKAGKKKKTPYTTADIIHDLHAIRVGIVAQSVLVGLLVLGLMWGLRRSRSAWVSRWMVVLALVLTQSFLFILPVKHLFALANFGGVLVGAASIVTLVGLFIRPSAKYIAACRDLSLPPERRGQPRPKLFGPRTAPAARPGAAPRGVASRPAAPRPSAAAAGKSKAKARSDAEAVARGAELARSRARASKSRRTDA